jgi:hypothetical protein
VPLIVGSSFSEPDANFQSHTDITADLTSEAHIFAVIDTSTVLEPTLSIVQVLAAIISGGTSNGDTFLRLNGEANVSLEAAVNSSSQMIGETFLHFNLNAQIFGSTEFSYNFIKQYAEKHELYVLLDIHPPVAIGSGNFQEYKLRLLINGVEVPIKDVNVSAPPSRVGTTINVTFSRAVDKSLLLPSNEFELQVATVISGVATWVTILDSGNLVNDNYSIGWGANTPTDQVSFGTDLSLNDLLNKSPDNPLVLYDSSLVDLSGEDFTPLMDTNGLEYATELKPIPGMTLYDVLREVFVTRIEFDNYVTNIPNFNVRRVNVDIGQSYLDAVGGIFGVFDPLLFEKNNVLYILDTTALLPAGFPAPRSITADWYKTVQLTRERLNLEGFILSYSDNDRGFDYFTIKLEQKTQESGSGQQYTEIYSETYTREYRRLSMPGVIVKTDIESQYKKVSAYSPDGSFTAINETYEYFYYDYFGRISQRKLEGYAYIPWLEDTETSTIIFASQHVRTEDDLYEYAQHPYIRDKQYRKSLTKRVYGLIYIDNNQYLNDNYKQEYIIAHRMGIISKFESINRTEGPILTRTEKEFPQRDGTTKVEVKEIDHISGAVTIDDQSEQAGQSTVGGLVPRTNRMIVYETDDHERSGGLLESLSIAEIPVELGIALARRKLKSARTRKRSLDMELIGLDHSLRRGSLLTVVGRGETIGVFIIEGYSISMSNLGTPEQIINMNLKGREI